MPTYRVSGAVWLEVDVSDEVEGEDESDARMQAVEDVALMADGTVVDSSGVIVECIKDCEEED